MHLKAAFIGISQLRISRLAFARILTRFPIIDINTSLVTSF